MKIIKKLMIRPRHSVVLSSLFLIILFFCLTGAFFPSSASSQARKNQLNLSYTLSMEKPHTHYFQVKLFIGGLTADYVDLKLPNWTPGYYRIMDYARHVINFKANDEAGHPLSWSKIAKNIWRIKVGRAKNISVDYNVYAFNVSVAESFLDARRAFVVPASFFMYPDGYLQNPIKLKIITNAYLPHVFCGLDEVSGETTTFYAPDFDILYDCPIYVGQPEVLQFEVNGVPHRIVAEDLGQVPRTKIINDFKKIVEVSVAIIGDLPYKHYTFILMDGGGGGLEHLNSMAAYMNASALQSPIGYKNWLAFIAHEYFHHYNVKRIRPKVLGPFDYDKENYTRMLWVSEGITVYYEYLILKRAGLLTEEEFFERMSRTIANYENIPGSKVQSAAESSFDTWIRFFARNEEAANTGISYYDKGAILGLLLDLKIRYETKNKKSFDDVMRLLYEKYYKKLKRGWTDEEFRAECEAMAGCSLAEIFDDYAATTKEIDYKKYFAYAGLEIDTSWHELPGVDLGITTQTSEGNLIIATVRADSPAREAGLSARDEIIALDGVRVRPQNFDYLLSKYKPGDKIKLLVSRRNRIQEIEVTLVSKKERPFRIKKATQPGELEKQILQTWLGIGSAPPSFE
ncbi:MAG: PDZ domain-containing protein [Candidatus Aminicenantes bacterium]|nr:PDZ domain-containing protein [Candidatus Aminicenantes bacterium]